MAIEDRAVFERVVRERSFTGASRALGVSKAYVSAAVARLERELGVRLLHRTTRHVRPTDVGSAYAERVRRALAELADADRAVQGDHEVPRGRLRVAASRVFGQAFLAPLLADLLRAWPELRCELVLTEQRVDLVEDGLDVAIRLGRLDESSYAARRLGDGPVGTFAHPAYLAARGTPRDPDDLAGHDGIVLLTEEWSKWWFSGPDGPRTAPIRARFRVNDLQCVRDLAAGGLGIAMMPAFWAAPEVRAGRLVPVLADRAPPPVPIWAVFAGRKLLSARVRTFLDVLVGRLAPEAPWTPREAAAASGVT